MAGVNIAHVPYKTTRAAISALLGGEVQTMFSTAGSIAQARSGKLRALAVTNAQPSMLLPDVPTLAASGLPGYEAVSKQGVLAPAATPTAIINRLNQEIVRILTSAEVKEKLLSTGAEPVGSSPEAFAVAIKSEIVRMGKVIRAAGIRVEWCTPLVVRPSIDGAGLRVAIVVAPAPPAVGALPATRAECAPTPQNLR